MKIKVVGRNKSISIGIIFLLILCIIGCGSGGWGPNATGTPSLILDGEWETLAAISTYPAFSDFTPTGKSVLYTGHGSSMQEFTFPTTGNPQGVFTTLTAPTGGIDYYISFAWVGDSLYLVQGNTVYAYSIAGNSWTRPVDGTLTYSHIEAQSTADDSGFVYSLVQGENQLLKYNTNDNTYVYIPTPSDLTYSEPRAAWDSATKRVYLADYATSSSGFYAFNPVDNSFTLLAPLPNSLGMSDAFCSDRYGHIFTADSDGSSYAFWVYTAATDTWTSMPDLPYAHGNNSSCTVSADGWLYFSDNGQTNIVRYKVF